MRVGIVGNRKCTDQRFVLENIAHIFDTHTLDNFDINAPRVTVVTGGESVGVSAFAGDFADIYGLDIIKFEPYFILDRAAAHNARHFFIRNKQLVDNCDQVLVFAYKKDSSDRQLISYAKEQGKEVFVVELKDNHVESKESREVSTAENRVAIGV